MNTTDDEVPDDLAAAKAEFHRRWKDLEYLTWRVAAGVRSLPAERLWSPPPPHAPGGHLADAVTALHYVQDQAPNESVKYHGVIGADPSLFEAFGALNDLRLRFIEQYDLLRAWVRQSDTGVSARQAELDRLLSANGLSRLHYRQTQRCFRRLSDPPRLITFTEVSTSNVRRVRRQWVMDQLYRKIDTGQPGIFEQIERLQSLDDEHLAEVIPLPPQLRINAAYGERGETRSLHIKTNLPLVVRLPEGEGLPPIRLHTKPESEGHRKARSRRKIESEPFLPSLHLHRYMEREARDPVSS